jgi:hypothetical protein
VLLFQVVPHRQFRVDCIGITPADFMTDSVTLGHQIANNFLNRPLSDVDFPGNLPACSLRVLRNVNEHPSMIGQESPPVRFHVFYSPVNNLT